MGIVGKRRGNGGWAQGAHGGSRSCQASSLPAALAMTGKKSSYHATVSLSAKARSDRINLAQLKGELPMSREIVLVHHGDDQPNDRVVTFAVRACMAQGILLLGICQGAQQIARVLGVEVGHYGDPVHEFGYYPISPTP